MKSLIQNKRGIWDKKIVTLILVILVVATVLMFVFKNDITRYLKNLPGYTVPPDEEIDVIFGDEKAVVAQGEISSKEGLKITYEQLIEGIDDEDKSKEIYVPQGFYKDVFLVRRIEGEREVYLMRTLNAYREFKYFLMSKDSKENIVIRNLGIEFNGEPIFLKEEKWKILYPSGSILDIGFKWPPISRVQPYKSSDETISKVIEKYKVETSSYKIYEEAMTISIKLNFGEMDEEEKEEAKKIVAGVISVESSWEANTIGDKGQSIGLMQIRIQDHRDKIDVLCGASSDDEERKTKLLNPECNIKVGVAILSDSYKMYENGIPEDKLKKYCSNEAYFEKFKNYRGWNAALRGYNGLSCETGNPNYVEEVNAYMKVY